MNSATIFSRIQRTAWIGWIFLLAGYVFAVGLRASCVSADGVAPPPMSVSGPGVIKIDDNTYAVLQGSGDIVISSNASTWDPPCLVENELSLPAIEEPETCTCVQAGPPPRHMNPADGPAVAISDGISAPSGISGVQMSNNNTELTWTISGSTNTGEYMFSESAVVRQNYHPCPEESGWYGGVTAGYKEAQVGEVEVTVIVFKIEIAGSQEKQEEGLDSEEFEVKITPNLPELAPSSYQWLTGHANGAWPALAGNNPELTYANPTASKTIVKKLRWFAYPNSRKARVTGNECEYKVNCEVTIGGEKYRATTPAKMVVVVYASGETSPAIFERWDTIDLDSRIVNGQIQWYVKGIGAFGRRTPVPTPYCAAGSQFYAKVMAHENKHVHQWQNESLKWSDSLDRLSLGFR